MDERINYSDWIKKVGACVWLYTPLLLLLLQQPVGDGNISPRVNGEVTKIEWPSCFIPWASAALAPNQYHPAALNFVLSDTHISLASDRSVWKL